MLALYERGNLFAGLYLEQSDLFFSRYLWGSEVSLDWTEINKSNNLDQLLAPLTEDNVAAMRLMAMSYTGPAYFGKDSDEALKWTEKAAEAGDPASQYDLAHREMNFGYKKLWDEPSPWLIKLFESNGHTYFAEIGDYYRQWGAWATSKLGDKTGQIKDPNFVEAIRWFRKGAESGSAKAQAGLAGMYEKGYGLPANYDEAKRWYTLAAENGDEESGLHFSLYYALGQSGSREGHLETVDYYRRKAESGDPESQYVLGAAYTGLYEGFPENKPEAVWWLEKAYEAGMLRAAYVLGRMCHADFRSFAPDNELKELIIEGLIKAAKADDSDALGLMGSLWFDWTIWPMGQGEMDKRSPGNRLGHKAEADNRDCPDLCKKKF